MGAPLVGDDLYGGVKDEILDRQAPTLSLAYVYSSNDEKRNNLAPLPKDMDEWIKAPSDKERESPLSEIVYEFEDILEQFKHLGNGR